MRNIKFSFNDKEDRQTYNTYNNIDVKMDNESYSIFSINGGGNCCLISDSGIEIFFDLESKRVGGLGGYLGSINNFKPSNISLSTANQEGIIYVDNNDEFIPGVAYSFSFNDDILYDKANKILLFGSYNEQLPTYKFLKNAYAQIDNGGSLSAILVTDISLDFEKSKSMGD